MDGIAYAGDKLWKELMGTDATRKTPVKVTGLSLSFSGIESMETGQKMIEGFLSGKERDKEKPVTIPVPLSGVDHQGDGGKPVAKRKRLPSGTADARGYESGGPSRQRGADDSESQDDGTGATGVEDRFTYTCRRCGHRVSLPSPSSFFHAGGARSSDGHGNGDQQGVNNDAEGEELDVDDEAALDAIKEALDRLRREHEDFHFAQDLQNEGGGQVNAGFKPGGSTNPKAGSTTKKRKKVETKPTAKIKEPKGSIAKFFVQK